ncbi:cupin domain-containing protein [Maribacter ulvicola]|uniref:Cupin domain-containing protein n=1 Tax=Maribacter ulvicola TaxID=228959 RepID=A0A1N6WPF1_9FLAO|nr:cupin domain-containing protein [Maribacter ulvicola]SIQ91989.1 Cupin domain-containing protein [Maribacter ulvicola]
MSNTWKFINKEDIMFEKAFGRNHYWHYHPNMIKSAGSYMVKVEVLEGDGHDFHRHPEMHEILYILKGQAEQWVEDEMQILDVGDSVYIDANVVHATFNAGKGKLEFLAVLSPPQGWEAGTIDVSQEEPYINYRAK